MCVEKNINNQTHVRFSARAMNQIEMATTQESLLTGTQKLPVASNISQIRLRYSSRNSIDVLHLPFL